MHWSAEAASPRLNSSSPTFNASDHKWTQLPLSLWQSLLTDTTHCNHRATDFSFLQRKPGRGVLQPQMKHRTYERHYAILEIAWQPIYPEPPKAERNSHCLFLSEIQPAVLQPGLGCDSQGRCLFPSCFRAGNKYGGFYCLLATKQLINVTAGLRVISNPASRALVILWSCLGKHSKRVQKSCWPLWTVLGEQLASVPLLSRQPSSILLSSQKQLNNQKQREKWTFLSGASGSALSPPTCTPTLFCCTPLVSVSLSFWGKVWIPVVGTLCSFFIKKTQTISQVKWTVAPGLLASCYCKVGTRYRNFKMWTIISYPNISQRNKGLDTN